MRKTETKTLGEVIREYLKLSPVDKKYKEYKLIMSWETLLGKTIANSTTNLYIKDGKLFVYLKSSVIRNELFMIRGEILQKLNENAGEELISEIVLR